MVSTNTQYYLRLLLLIVNVATPTLLKTFLKFVNDSTNKNVDTFLNCFEDDFKALKRKRIIKDTELKKLFPTSGKTVVEEWDISLLCLVLSHCCTLDGKFYQLKDMLLQESRVDINTLVNINKSTISSMKDNEINQYEYDIMFPDKNADTKLEKWNMNLVIQIIIKLFPKKITNVIKLLREICINEIDLKFSNVGINEFLKFHSSTLGVIKDKGILSEAQFDELFSDIGSDINKWDDHTLRIVLLNTTSSLSKETINAVRTLRTIRSDFLAHRGDAEIEFTEFSGKYRELTGAVMDILKEEEWPTSEVEQRIKDIVDGPLEVQSCLDCLKAYYTKESLENDKIVEALDKVCDSVEFVNQKLEAGLGRIDSRFDAIVEHLDNIERKLPESAYTEKADIRCVKMIFAIQIETVEKKEEAENIIINAMKQAEQNTTAQIQAAFDVIKKIVTADGKTIVSIDHGSVILGIKCISLKGLHQLLKYTGSELMQSHLTEAATALSAFLKEVTSLTVHVSLASLADTCEDVVRCLNYYIDHTSHLKMTIQRSTIQELQNVVREFRVGEGASQLRVLSSELSDYLGEKISIDTVIPKEVLKDREDELQLTPGLVQKVVSTSPYFSPITGASGSDELQLTPGLVQKVVSTSPSFSPITGASGSEIIMKNDRSPERLYGNWLKVCLSLVFMKEALEDFTDEQMRNLHSSIKANLLQQGCLPIPPGCLCKCCSAQNISRQQKPPRWKLRPPCSINLCDKWLVEILAQYTHLRCPNVCWDNTNLQLWPVHHWEMAKVFQPHGCANNQSSTDANVAALLTLMVNCTHFHQFIQRQPILQEIENVRNKTMHTKFVREQDMLTDISKIIDLLKDPLHLGQLTPCKEAVIKIEQLRDNKIDLSLNRELELKALMQRTTAIEIVIQTTKREHTVLNDDVDVLKDENRTRKTESGELKQKLETQEKLEKNIDNKIFSIGFNSIGFRENKNIRRQRIALSAAATHIEEIRQITTLVNGKVESLFNETCYNCSVHEDGHSRNKLHTFSHIERSNTLISNLTERTVVEADNIKRKYADIDLCPILQRAIDFGTFASLGSSSSSDNENEDNDGHNLRLYPYQLELAENAIKGMNTIVCAGTGSGKTFVALHVINQHFKGARGPRKVAFMAMTSVLVRQQSDRCKQYFNDLKVKLVVGDDYDSKMLGLFLHNYDILCFTPQILVNNLANGSINSVSDFTLLILDECHHTKGSEPYNILMQEYLQHKTINARNLPQVLGLTATIGIDKSHTEMEARDYILRVMACLDVTRLSQVERNKEHYLEKTVEPMEEKIPMRIPGSNPCKEILLKAIDDTEDRVQDMALMQPSLIELMVEKCPSKKESQEYQKWTIDVMKTAQQSVDDFNISRNVSAYAKYLNNYNAAIEVNSLLRPADIITFLAEKHKEDSEQKEKLTQVENELLKKLNQVQKDVLRCKATENPNVRILGDTLKQMLADKGDDSRAMVFVKTRTTCKSLAAFLNIDLRDIDVKTSPLYGKENRGSDDGMTEAVQNDVLEKFRQGFYKVIVATSVGVEGIDVPDCNIVLSYNYSCNEITKIQMKGRSRKHGATAITMGSQNIMEEEEINAYKASMMQSAMKLVRRLSENEVNKKVKQFQSEEVQKMRFRKQVEESNLQQKTGEDVLIQCIRCHARVAYLSDIRAIGTQHIVIDKSLENRINIRPHKSPKVYEGFKKHSKMYCKTCPMDWGIIANKDGLTCRILKITGVSRLFWKWDQVPGRVQEIKSEDLQRLLGSSAK